MSHTLGISRVGLGGRAVNDIQRIIIEPGKRGGQTCIRGLVYTHPRPAPAHARASSALGNKVGMPFDQREDFAAIDLSGLRVD